MSGVKFPWQNIQFSLKNVSTTLKINIVLAFITPNTSPVLVFIIDV
jgi:hypothetical protein